MSNTKKAVIATGGKQYLVTEGQTLEVELLNDDEKTASFVPLMVIDGDNVAVGTPEVTGSKVQAEIVEQQILGDKVLAIRYKAKKRVHKIHGHRQRSTVIKITKIA
ncbi:MAG: 50S ribosomal protein L21 [Candidatus Saccharibacteria bacterium]|jgi:large subunit ribosomal protein L21